MDGGGDRGPPLDGTGCAYLVELGGVGRRRCDRLRRPGSPYCAAHHALCHVATGSAAEARRLNEIEALADAVGGRHALADERPRRRFLDHLEHKTRVFS